MKTRLKIHLLKILELKKYLYQKELNSSLVALKIFLPNSEKIWVCSRDAAYTYAALKSTLLRQKELRNFVDIDKIINGFDEDFLSSNEKEKEEILALVDKSLHPITIISAIWEIPSQERPFIIQNILKLIRLNFSFNIPCMAARLHIMSAFFTNEEINTLTDEYKQFGFSSHYDTLQFIDFFTSRNDYLIYLSFFKSLSEIQKNKLLKAVAGYFRFESFFSPLKQLILILPPADVIKIFPQILKENKPDHLVQELAQNRFLQKRAAHHMIAQFHSGDISPSIKLEIANLVIKWSLEKLHLSEEHPLIQEALAVITLNSSDSLTHSSNPYRIYDHLKRITSSEEYFEAIPPEMEMPLENGACLKLSWALPFLRAQEAFTSYKASDLPKNVRKSTLAKLFNALQRRYNRIEDAPLKQQLRACIRTQFEVDKTHKKPISYLRNNLLGKPFIPGILAVKPSVDGTVSRDLFHLYSILNFILSLSNDLEVGKLLSPQEEALLAFSQSVQFCDTGQQEGCAAYYTHFLPPSFKMEMREVVENKIIDPLVQKHLYNVFRKDELLKDLITATPIAQEVHQIRYLENRFRRQLGYKAPLRFDPHTHNLYKELLETSPEIIFKKLLNHLDIAPLVHDLIEASKEIFKDENKKNSNTLIELVGKALPSPLTLHDVILCDEETSAWQALKPSGAVFALIGSGYIIQNK